MSRQETSKKQFLDWQKIVKETIGDMENLHEEKILITLADIRKKRKIDSHGAKAKQIERSIEYLVSWGIVDQIEAETCFTCGHELRGPFYVLKKFMDRYERYVEPNLSEVTRKKKGMAKPKAKCQQCGKLCDSTKLTKGKLLCPTCKKRAL